MGYIELDRILSDYVQRGIKNKDKPIRPLNSMEIEWIDSLRKRKRAMNELIIEIITILSVLRQIKEPKLFYVSKNLNRVIASLQKQRDMAFALSRTIGNVEPFPFEIPKIKTFITKTGTRIDFISSFVIPENLKLTPIQEYLEIKGVDNFTKDIRERIGDRWAQFEANIGRNSEIKEYATDIFEVVNEKGMTDKYKERLQKYVEVEENRLTEQKERKQQEKRERDFQAAQEGMDLFRRMFWRGIQTLKGCDKIEMGRQTVQRRVSRIGRNNYVVLCCYAFQGRILYRYADEKGNLVNTFFKAGAFKDRSDAVRIMTELEKQYPDRIFDVVRMDGLVDVEEVRA